MNQLKKNIIKTNIKKIYCSNCGKYGHNFNKCNEPISSFGVIAIKVNDELFKNISKNRNMTDVNISKINSINNNIFLKTHKYKNDIEFLMICRRKSLGYLEFVRGRYSLNDFPHIMSLFEQMTEEEIKYIGDNDFDTLWGELWVHKNTNKFFTLEYEKSKTKFTLLKEKKENNLEYLVKNTVRRFDNPEWGFPKGRRNFLEKDLNCAVREFKEESGLENEDFILVPGIKPLEEIFNGTNNILYRHIYFIAFCRKDIKVDISKPDQLEEIGNIGWFNHNQCMSLFRKFHKKRKYLLNELYMFICNILEKNVDLDSY